MSEALYHDYLSFKTALFKDICQNNPSFDTLTLFNKTQKLLLRLLVLFFAEARGLLPTDHFNEVHKDWIKSKKLYKQIKLYDLYKAYFNLSTIVNLEPNCLAAYFAPLAKDEALDRLIISDEILYEHIKKLSLHDFVSNLSIEILGRVYERSLSEIDEISKSLHDIKNINKRARKRNKDGVFYTPKVVTNFIVEEALGKLVSDYKNKIGLSTAKIESFLNDESLIQRDKGENSKQVKEFASLLSQYRRWLLEMKICDPACGAAAFLCDAFIFLKNQHESIDSLENRLCVQKSCFEEINITIVKNNLYGVDINKESLEIGKLSLWLLASNDCSQLSDFKFNLLCGNSLIEHTDLDKERAFNWHKKFPNVFQSGGFDVIIGNPPYVQIQSMREQSAKLKKCKYSSFNKGGDIYCLFYEKGIELLKQGGILGFISSNKWLITEYGRALRKLIIERSNPFFLINLAGKKIFTDAAVDSNILFLEKEKYISSTKALVINQGSFNPSHIDKEIAETYAFNDEPWIIAPKKVLNILNLMKTTSVTLKDLPIEIYNGIKTGLNDAFYIDEITKSRLVDEDPKSAELISPFFRGRDIKPYTALHSLWMINTHNGIKAKGIQKVQIESYPAIKKHLDFWYPELEKRYDKGDSPYHLRNCAYLQEFYKAKIIYPNMTSKFPFLFDESGILINQKCFFIVAKDDSFPLRALLGILNSRYCKTWIHYNCPDLGSGGREISKVYFENFPLPDILSPKLSHLFTKLELELCLRLSHEKAIDTQRKRLIQQLKENFDFFTSPDNLERFWELDYKNFIKILKKQKVILSHKEHYLWEDCFNHYKSNCLKLANSIKTTEMQIEKIVEKMYTK